MQKWLPGMKGRGGRREGAGRKPAKGRRRVSHDARRRFRRGTLHVTVRLRAGLPSMRRLQAFGVMMRELCAANGRFGMRVAEFSVMSNHVHLIVEADDQQALSKGMQGLGSRWAKALNALWGRRGKAWAERYFAVLIKRPIVLHHTLTYVLNNAVRHGVRLARGQVDRFSSGRWFRGWAGGWSEGEGWSDPLSDPGSDSWAEAPTFEPEYWLLNVGWKRHGLIPLKASVAALIAAAGRRAG